MRPRRRARTGRGREGGVNYVPHDPPLLPFSWMAAAALPCTRACIHRRCGQPLFAQAGAAAK
eukprot:4335543-Pyramimonas_sp.AAC.1